MHHFLWFCVRRRKYIFQFSFAASGPEVSPIPRNRDREVSPTQSASSPEVSPTGGCIGPRGLAYLRHRWFSAEPEVYRGTASYATLANGGVDNNRIRQHLRIADERVAPQFVAAGGDDVRHER